MELLVNQEGRLDDAIIIATTCLKLDHNNAAIKNLVDSLQSMKTHPIGSPMAQLEQDYRGAPGQHPGGIQSGAGLLQNGQSDKGFAVLDEMLASPKADKNVVVSIINAYNMLKLPKKIEAGLKRLTEIEPEVPEGWYDLAGIRLGDGQVSNEALQNCATRWNCKQRPARQRSQSRRIWSCTCR